MAYLVIHTTRAAGMSVTWRIPLEHAMVVGRSADSGVRLDDDSKISRHHFRIEPIHGTSPTPPVSSLAATPKPGEMQWALIDLNSTNGTHVGGQRVMFERLRDGDEITAGQTRIVFHSGRMPPTRPSSPAAATQTASADRSVSSGTTVAGELLENGQSIRESLSDSRVVLAAIRGGDGASRALPKVEPNPDLPQREVTASSLPLAFRRPPARPIVRSRSRGIAGHLQKALKSITQRLREATSE